MSDLLSVVEASLSASPLAVVRSDASLSISWPEASLRVLAVEHERDGQRAVVLLAPICDETAIDPRHLLRMNGELGGGAIAIVDGCYVVRFAVPAAQLSSAPLFAILAYVHDLAASLVPARAFDASAVQALAYLAA